MNYDITNKAELDAWMNERMRLGHDMAAVKSAPPEGMTYDDGTPVKNPINVAWVDQQTGERIAIEWGSVESEQTNPPSFQERVRPWLLECFGEIIAGDRKERNHRFLEESLELVQACGCTREEAVQLVDYVYGRPVGETAQEVGGVMVTLAALCLAQGIDMHDAGEVELTRINQPEIVKKIRAKQAAKPKFSPLPGPSAS